MSVKCILVQTMDNVCPKAIVGVVFVFNLTTAMIAEKVNERIQNQYEFHLILMCFQFIDQICVTMFIVVMANVAMVFVNAIPVIRVLDVKFHVRLKSINIIQSSYNDLFFILADRCAGVNCHYGTCYEGHCSCSEGYTGPYCETASMCLHPIIIHAS